MVPGCTDPLAFNYNPSANFDDGSCIPVVLGCTDTLAANYNAAANTDDGTCFIISCASITNAPFAETFDVLGNYGPFSDAFSSGATNTSAAANWGWTQDNLGTPSFNTGPTTGALGTNTYMYTEASGAGYPNKVANLACEYDFSGQSAGCLQFYYHMFGATTGSLDVKINGASAPGFPVSGQQHNSNAAAYTLASIDLAAYLSLIHISEPTRPY